MPLLPQEAHSGLCPGPGAVGAAPVTARPPEGGAEAGGLGRRWAAQGAPSPRQTPRFSGLLPASQSQRPPPSCLLEPGDFQGTRRPCFPGQTGRGWETHGVLWGLGQQVKKHGL